MAFKAITSLPQIVEGVVVAGGMLSAALTNAGVPNPSDVAQGEMVRIRDTVLSGGSSSSSQATPGSSSAEVKTQTADEHNEVVRLREEIDVLRRGLREVQTQVEREGPDPPPPRILRTEEQNTRDWGEAGPDPQTVAHIAAQEYSIIANFFGITPDQVRASAELSRLALPAITGIGRIFDGANNLPAVLEAVRGARGDYELSRGAPVSEDQFASVLVANGVSGSRIQRAFDAIRIRIGENPVAVATFRKWLLRRVLPGAATAAASYVLKRVAESGVGGSVPGSSYSDRASGGAFDMDTIRADLLDDELRDVLRDVDIGDQASHLVDHGSWAGDRLAPVEGSVKWTPNPTHDYGFQSSILPRSSPNIAIPAENRIVLPGNEIFGRRMQGDSLTERHSDSRAHVTKSVLTVDPSTVADSAVVGVESGSSGVRGFHRISGVRGLPVWAQAELVSRELHAGAVSAVPVSRERAAAPVSAFPGVHEEARDLDHAVSVNYDPVMTTSLPSFVSAHTSSAASEYIGENRSYRQAFDDVPNVVGIGFDEVSTERVLMDRVATRDGASSVRRDGGRVTFESSLPPEKRQRTTDSGPSVSSADATNPAFANVGVAVPRDPIPQIHMN